MAEDELIFSQAGTELAQLAIEKPGKYLQVLQGLKRIQDNTGRTLDNYQKSSKRFIISFAPDQTNPRSQEVGILMKSIHYF